MPRLVLAIVGFVAACGAGDPPPVALHDFGPAAEDALCDWAVRCVHVPDRPTCQRLIDPKSYDTRRAEDAVAAGRLAYDDRAAGACIDATRHANCLATPFTDPSCGEIFTGLLGEGATCTSDYECAGGGGCGGTTCDAQCCLGSCGPPLTGQPPDPPQLARVGESCTTHQDCVLGAYCETDGRCTPMPDAEGERCLFGCARGDLYCDTTDLVCHRYGAAGESCDPAGQTAPPCDPSWSFCDGVCTPRPGPGEACDDTRVCIASSFCDGGTCRAREAAGAPCTASDQCDVTCDLSAGKCVEYATCTTGP